MKWDVIYHHDADPRKQVFEMWLEGEHVGDARTWADAWETLRALMAEIKRMQAEPVAA